MSLSLMVVVAAVELILAVAGLALLCRRPAILTAWNGSVTGFFLFLWFVICGALISSYFASLWLKYHVVSTDFREVLGIASFQLGLLAGVVVFKLSYGRRMAPVAPVSKSANPFLAGAAAYLVTVPVVLFVGLVWQGLLDLCGISAPPQEALDILRNAHNGSLALLLACAIVIAPITEELIFRAGIFRYVRTRMPRWAALLLPACLFGALHSNVSSFAPLVALGVVFSLAYERTGRISTSIVAHALFNLSTTLLVLAGVDL